MIEFNVNDYVWVKLTDRGREIHAKYWKQYGMTESDIKEDEDGWSKWQLHNLMHIFGSDCVMGPPVPFETAIRFESAEVSNLRDELLHQWESAHDEICSAKSCTSWDGKKFCYWPRPEVLRSTAGLSTASGSQGTNWPACMAPDGAEQCEYHKQEGSNIFEPCRWPEQGDMIGVPSFMRTRDDSSQGPQPIKQCMQCGYTQLACTCADSTPCDHEWKIKDVLFGSSVLPDTEVWKCKHCPATKKTPVESGHKS